MPGEISPEELAAIVKRAQQGSAADFHALYELFVKRIYNFILRLIGSREDAEDLTQETFLKVHRELKKLRDRKQFRYWLYRIARNEVYQKLRRSKKKGSEISLDGEEGPLDWLLADEGMELDPERAFLSQELNEVILCALRSLTPKYRDVFVLAVFQKMKYVEISRIVGRSLLSVKTDIYRARLVVKDHVKTYLGRKQ
jgi:RNA polymerase sigma-70 factor (ECF subfamily)